MRSRAANVPAVRLPAVLLLSLVVLLGACGDPEGDGAGTPKSSSSPAPEPDAPSSEPEDVETSALPAVPATGPWLDTGYAKVRAPQGWRRSDNFGFERVQQASTKVPHPALVHLALHQREPSVGSVEELARFTARELRTRLRMGRFDVGDEVVVDGARATRLDGRVTDRRAATAYAVMVGDLRWTLLFDIDPAMPEESREELMASVLATWEFVRPS